MQILCFSIAKIRFFHDKHYVSNKKTRCIIFIDFIFVLLQTIMNIRRLFIFISLAFSCLAQAQPISLETLKRIGLPVVVVETIDAEEPTCEYLTPDEGFPGYSIRNETKVPGRVQVIKGDSTIYDSGNYEEDISGMTIKIRGNGHAFLQKKPFKIKLQKKADMIGNNNHYKDKNWVLLKDENPSINLMVGLKVNELVGLQWTPRFRYVNLVFNGDYRGVYMLCESVKRNNNCRLNVSDSGFIFEYDPYWWKENLWFKSNMSERKYTFKYPDEDNVTEEQLQYLIDYMTKVDLSLYDGKYNQYIDLESFATWVLAHDILGTYDASGSNIFITKYDDGDSTKLMMANMWDFDSIEQTPDKFSMVHINTGGFYPYPLFHSQNKAFTKTYIARWKEVKTKVFEEMEKLLNDFASSELSTALESSRSLDFKRWETTGPTVAENIESNKIWFSDRKIWLENAISEMEKEIESQTPIVSIKSESLENKHKKYNLQGQLILNLNHNHRGIIIENGHKYLK